MEKNGPVRLFEGLYQGSAAFMTSQVLPLSPALMRGLVVVHLSSAFTDSHTWSDRVWTPEALPDTTRFLGSSVRVLSKDSLPPV